MENSYTPQDPNTHLLDDIDQSLVQASSGKRFGNYLVDRIVIYLVWRVFFATIGTRFALLLYSDGDTLTTIYIKLYAVIVVLDLFMWTALEYLTRGKTIGKLLTSTRAVNEDGTYISFKTALLRSLSRMVPFEPFSALGNPSYPWHDRWTKTIVIDERQSRMPVQ